MISVTGRVPALSSLLLLVLASVLGCSSTVRQEEAGEHDSSGLEEEVFELINSHRRSKGLPSLVWEERLAVVSRLHSSRMAGSDHYLGHAGIEFRGTMVGSIMECAIYRENVAMAFNVPNPASRVVLSWLESNTHRRNIESDATLTGVGVSRGASGTWFFVQVFVKDNTYISGEDNGLDEEPPIPEFGTIQP